MATEYLFNLTLKTITKSYEAKVQFWSTICLCTFLSTYYVSYFTLQSKQSQNLTKQKSNSGLPSVCVPLSISAGPFKDTVDVENLPFSFKHRQFQQRSGQKPQPRGCLPPEPRLQANSTLLFPALHLPTVSLRAKPLLSYLTVPPPAAQTILSTQKF